MDPLVDLRDVEVSLGGRPVLKKVNLSLRPGQRVGVSGANGSDKTTLIRTLATLLSPSAGEGEVLGVSLSSSDLAPARTRIGMIGHAPSLIPELTLRENLLHLTKLGGLDTKRVEPALDVVGLSDVADRGADAASFGMSRRVEFAHVMLRRPTLLLLDEAMGGLDESAQQLVGAVADSCVERGGGVAMVSHDAQHLASHCDQIMYLANGYLEAAR